MSWDYDQPVSLTQAEADRLRARYPVGTVVTTKILRELRGEGPYDQGVGATGPLPRGWHRVTWLDSKDRPRHLITDDIASAALAEVALLKSSLRIAAPDSVVMESWSDPENGERS